MGLIFAHIFYRQSVLCNPPSTLRPLSSLLASFASGFSILTSAMIYHLLLPCSFISFVHSEHLDGAKMVVS
jgi:hypothetical protein